MNMSTICPRLLTVLMNIYSESSDLILGTCTLQSQEGTTQGDPLAMPFYALTTRPLIDALDKDLPDLRQIWYADDATAIGKLCDLKHWWEKLSMIGPSFGYYVNPSKTWLVIKEKCISAASYLFGELNVNITTEGRPVLDSPIGKPEFISNFVDRKVNQWIREIEKLTEVADSQPHAAYAAMTHGFTSKWTYLTRTMPNISELLAPLEQTIRIRLIPKLTGREAPNDSERQLFALPT